MQAEHAELVWASLQRLGVRDRDLEDLMQEVFVVVHHRLDSFDPTRSMPRWLFGICRRVAAAHRRRAYTRREEPREGAGEGEIEEAPDPEQTAEARQMREQMERVLGDLKPELRVVLVMFEVEDLPCEAIAEELGIPVGTVYSRLHNARKAFERALSRRRARGGVL
ncbi:MAG: sigma-70 family RNA polymerase sigma factor [Polyangiaceae bacterium]